MCDIVTVTLNPAIDRYGAIDYPGGKGINVSRALKKMGTDSEAVFFAGGDTGKKLVSLIESEGITCSVVETVAPTRVNIKTPCGEFNASGGPINEEELAKLIQKIEIKAKSADKSQLYVISGSIPQGVEKPVYNFLIKMLKECGNMTALDTGGENLHKAICTGPDIIKPNLAELESLLGTRISTIAQAVEKCFRLFEDTGIEVLCTMGGNVSIYAGADGLYTADSLQVEVRSTVGAGDTFLAAFIHERMVTGDVTAALRFASGAAAAKVTLPGTVMPDLAEMRRYAEKVRVTNA